MRLAALSLLTLALALLALPALPVWAQSQEPEGPFLLEVHDPTNSHFARESQGKDWPRFVREALASKGASMQSVPGEVTSLEEAQAFAGKAGARFFLYSSCGILIEGLKACDSHIKFCPHRCEARVVETVTKAQLSQARVTGEKGGTDAVLQLKKQLASLLLPLDGPLQQIAAEKAARVASEKAAIALKAAEKAARAAAEKAQRELENVQREQLAAEAARKAAGKVAGEKLTKAQEEKAAREEAQRRAEEGKMAAAAQRAAAAAQRTAAAAQALEDQNRLAAEKAAQKLVEEKKRRIAADRSASSRQIFFAPGQRLAILDFENDLTGGARSQVNNVALTEAVRGAVGRAGLGLNVLAADSAFDILRANEKKVLECSADCEASLGRILGVEYVVSGRLARAAQKFKLSMLLYRSQDGALLSDATGTSDDLSGIGRQTSKLTIELLSVFPPLK